MSRQVAALAGGAISICLCSCSLASPPAELASGNANETAKEAPSGFDDATNGFENQEAFDRDREAFEEVETIRPQRTAPTAKPAIAGKRMKDWLSGGYDGSSSSEQASGGGLGPVYNATSCASCHQNPVSGSSSQISEMRAGHNEKGKFIEHPGGSLVHQRAIDAAIQEHVTAGDTIRTLRMSTTTLGNGFIEMIPDEEIRQTQKVRRRHNQSESPRH